MHTRRTATAIFSLATLVLAVSPVQCLADPFWFLDNARISLDNAVDRTQALTDSQWRGRYAVGLDYHKVISSRTGDIGTLIAQPYYVRLVNVCNAPVLN